MNSLIPTCNHVNCDNLVYQRYDKKWAKHCSKKCQMSDTSTRGLAKRKQTCMEKYGVENPKQSPIIQQRIEDTCLERYGHTNPFGNDEIKEKIKITNQKKYGVDNPRQSPQFVQKSKDTCIDRYGVENPSQSDLVKEQKRTTTQKNYGVENPFESKTIQEQIKTTMIENYGVDNPSKSPELQDKKRRTKEALGQVIPQSQRTEKKNYYRLVDNLTNVNYKKHKDKINPNNLKRGRFTFHLDHKYSRFDGFINDVPVEVIAHWANLVVVPCQENLTKNRQSNITQEELYKFIEGEEHQ